MLIKSKKASQFCIKKRYEFLRIQRQGNRFRSKFVVLIVKNSKNHGLFGLTVSKSIGKSHVRNLIKRRLRHVLQLNSFMFLNNDLIILALPEIVNASFQEIEKDIAYLYGRFRNYHRSRISYTTINQ